MKRSKATTFKDKIEYLLQRYPSFRDSDKKLFVSYMLHFHGLKELLGNTAYTKLKKALLSSPTPSIETIRRNRQRFQEQGLYVGKKRKEYNEKMKKKEKKRKKKEKLKDDDYLINRYSDDEHRVLH